VLELQAELDKAKQSKMRELADINAKHQFKIDECEKAKTTISKITEELSSKDV
jgi:hypothetical protein